MKNFDLRKFLSENKFTIGNTNKKSNTTSVKVDTLVESKKIKEAKKEKAESVNEASLFDKMMRSIFFDDNPELQKLGKSIDTMYLQSEPMAYKNAVKNLSNIELTNYWDKLRRSKWNFNQNAKFVKRLIKIEMEKRKLKMLPDLGK